MIINVFFNNLFERERQLKNAVSIINSVQNYYAFILKGLYDSDISDINTPVSWNDFCDNHTPNTIPEVYITNQAFDDNWFSHGNSSFAVISTYDWERRFAPPSLKAYIMYQLAEAAINFAGDLNEEVLMNVVHDPSKGCMFDICINKSDIKLGMIGGAICSECKSTLRMYGIEERSIEAVEKILEYVRNEAIGKPNMIIENKAFIVMKFSYNDENDHVYKFAIKPALNALNIESDRADEHLQSGPLLEKIIKSIKRARFVIAKVDENNLNVYYELGLAMGLEKDVILLSEDTLVLNLPSDLKNWECITYPKGNYEVLEGKIMKFFRDNYEVLQDETFRAK